MLKKLIDVLKGGQGSGNFGHGGRPGEQGGSSSESGNKESKEGKDPEVARMRSFLDDAHNEASTAVSNLYDEIRSNNAEHRTIKVALDKLNALTVPHSDYFEGDHASKMASTRDDNKITDLRVEATKMIEGVKKLMMPSIMANEYPDSATNKKAMRLMNGAMRSCREMERIVARLPKE